MTQRASGKCDEPKRCDYCEQAPAQTVSVQGRLACRACDESIAAFVRGEVTKR